MHTLSSRQGQRCLYAAAFILVVLLTVPLLAPLAHAVSPDDPPLARQAYQASIEGDYPRAADLYRRALEADPTNSRLWYNYACSLTRGGDTEHALLALEHAITAGYRDSSYAVNDSDFVALRDTPEFARLTSRMGRLAREEEARRDTPHYLRQSRFGTYWVHLPDSCDVHSGRRYPAVVLLHGRGGNHESMVPWIEKHGLPNVIYIFAEAPYADPRTRGGFEYWPWSMPFQEGIESADEAMVMFADWCRDMLRDAEQYAPIDRKRVAIVGHSQGSGVALVAAIEHPEVYAGAAMLAGYVPDNYKVASKLRRLADSHVALFIVHGRRDQVVGLFQGTAAKNLAEGQGVEVTMETYDCGHALCDSMFIGLNTWLNKRFNPENEE